MLAYSLKFTSQVMNFIQSQASPFRAIIVISHLGYRKFYHTTKYSGVVGVFVITVSTEASFERRGYNRGLCRMVMSEVSFG